MSEIPFDKLCKRIIDNRGKTCPTALAGTALIATNCIKNEHLYPVFEKVRFVDDTTRETWFRGHPKPGDILFVTKGTPGRVAWVPDPVNFCIAQDMVALEVDECKIYPKYLFAALRSPHVQGTIENLHVGSLIPHFKKGDFHKLQIPVPDRSTQEFIGDLYFLLSSKIDLLHRQNQTLEQMVEVFYQAWFLEESPNQWEQGVMCSLDELIESVSVTHPLKTDKVIFLNTSDIYGGFVENRNYSEVSGLPGQAKKSIRKHDILYSEIRPANKRYAYIDFEACDYVVSTKLMVLRAKQQVNPAVVYFYLTHPLTLQWLQMIAETRSGTFPQITFDQVKTMRINLPSGETLERVSAWLESTLDKLHANNHQIRTLEQLRDTLLPKLMSGEVRVSSNQNELQPA